jgi:hypothetical protein
MSGIRRYISYIDQDFILQNLQTYGTKEIELPNGKRLCYRITCEHCEQLHYKAQCEILRGLSRKKKFFCSRQCHHNYHSTKQETICANCNSKFLKLPSQISKSKSGNSFCSKSCATTFNNRNKEYGTRRSKIEQYIDERIKIALPNLVFLCNNKEIIGSELDFYFPELQLGIQINGIVHYKPIYGQSKLDQIQKIDQEKREVCAGKGITLFELDCSNDKYLNKTLKNKRWEQVNYHQHKADGLSLALRDIWLIDTQPALPSAFLQQQR